MVASKINFNQRRKSSYLFFLKFQKNVLHIQIISLSPQLITVSVLKKNNLHHNLQFQKIYFYNTTFLKANKNINRKLSGRYWPVGGTPTPEVSAGIWWWGGAGCWIDWAEVGMEGTPVAETLFVGLLVSLACRLLLSPPKK